MVAYGRNRHPGKVDPLALPTEYKQVILADSPVSYWPMEAVDTSEPVGNRTITFSNSPSAATGGPTDSATDFNGTNQYGQASASTVWTPSGDLTFETWVWLDVSTSDQVAVDAAPTTGNPYYWLFDINGGKWRGSIGRGDGSPHLAATDSSSVTTDAWTHLACTVSGTTIRLYRNGTEVASSSTTSGSRFTAGTSTSMQFGRYNATWQSDSLLNGRLAWTAFYGSALSAARIAARQVI